MISKTARWLIGTMLVGGAAAYVYTMPEGDTPVAFQGPPQRAYDATPGDRIDPAAVAVAALAGRDDAGGAASPPEAANPLAALDFDAMTATRDRPLFTPSRTGPFAPPPEDADFRDFEPEPEVVAEPPPPVRLVGLMMIGDGGIALLRDEATGLVTRVRDGEDFAGWELHVVDDRSVSLSRDGEEHVMAMLVPGSPAPRPDLPIGDGFGSPGLDPGAAGVFDPYAGLGPEPRYLGGVGGSGLDGGGFGRD